MNPAEPADPEERLQALRARLARSALYSQPFEIGSEPFRVPPGLVCLKCFDDVAGTVCLRLANGKADAASARTTEGYSIRLPDSVQSAASGGVVSVTVIARAAAGMRSRFALAYSTHKGGNSGWHWQEADPEWRTYSLNYDVPVIKDGGGDFVGILPDTEGQPGTEFCHLAVSTTGGPGFPAALFQYDWYADIHTEPQLTREVAGETRFRESIRHYLKRGLRERLDPNPLFDAKWYATRFGVAEDQDPLVHFARAEASGEVSPNRWWEFVRRRGTPVPRTAPSLASVLHEYPASRKPTYIIGLSGSGRMYLSSLMVNADPAIAYYFRGVWRHYFGAVPVILSGHVTSIYTSAFCSDPCFGRALLERAAADLINLIFVYRHPLDSLLSNWVWFRRYLREAKKSLGIADSYDSVEDFHRDLSENFSEFRLFCDGSRDFARVVTGSEMNWSFLSLREFVEETEAFRSAANVHSFRFEDLRDDVEPAFARLLSIVGPDAPSRHEKLPAPQASSSRYGPARENVSVFRNHIDALPAELTRRIVALGYSV